MTNPIKTEHVRVPVNAAGAYVAQDCVGGKLPLIDNRGFSEISRKIVALSVVDRANQRAGLNILIFSADPAAGTYTDSSPPIVAAADDALCLGVIQVTAGYYVQIGTAPGGIKAFATLAAPDIPVGRDCHIVVTTPDTPTYPNATDLELIFALQEQ